LFGSLKSRIVVLFHNPDFHTAGNKKAGAIIPVGISATRLSQGDPIGFPSHPRRWFSIFVYLFLFQFMLAVSLELNILLVFQITKKQLKLIVTTQKKIIGNMHSVK